jgi:hypothetical protein
MIFIKANDYCTAEVRNEGFNSKAPFVIYFRDGTTFMTIHRSAEQLRELADQIRRVLDDGKPQNLQSG